MAGISNAAPRDRLLAAADVLFYEEGIHAVGIDRVLEVSGVAKASLYSHFGSKDALVAAYLELRAQKRRARIENRLATLSSPRERILGIFTLLGEIAAEPGFRGCPWVNASAENALGKETRAACLASRAWTRDLFINLCKDGGAADAAGLGAALAVLYDGAAVAAAVERDAAVVAAARAAAVVLLDAAGVGPAASADRSS